MLLQVFHSLICGRHVGYFNIVLNAVCYNLFCFFHANFILCCTWHNNINFYVPWFFTGIERYAEFVCIVLYFISSGSSHFKHIIYFFTCNSVGIINITVRTGNGYCFTAKFRNFLCSAPCNVSEAGQCKSFAFDRIIVVFQNFITEVNSTKTCSFRT